MYKVPVIKYIRINSLTTRFGQTFAILLESGMQVFDCMKVMPKVINEEIGASAVSSFIVEKQGCQTNIPTVEMVIERMKKE